MTVEGFSWETGSENPNVAIENFESFELESFELVKRIVKEPKYTEQGMGLKKVFDNLLMKLRTVRSFKAVIRVYGKDSG